jgi:hypothetical protein
MRKLKNVPIEENDSSRRLIRYFRPPVLGAAALVGRDAVLVGMAANEMHRHLLR